MPYLAPEAAIPTTSCAPRLAERNARPHTQAGMERPARKKSVLVFVYLRSATPVPRTKAKYTPMMIQSIAVNIQRSAPPDCKKNLVGISTKKLSERQRQAKRQIRFRLS